MPGLTNETPRPTEIKFHQKSRVLDLSFSDGKTFHLPCEFLRVYSPSAEVSGHGPGQEVLQTGKSMVSIQKIVPVGNYAIQLYFTDGHNTGLYSWDLLHRFGSNFESMWQRYLQRMEQAGKSREPKQAKPSQSTSCPSCQ